jgi:anti-sigma factor RsiW
LSHDDWTGRLSDYLDGALRADERAALETHLVSCDECARTLEELRAVVARARSLPDRAPEQDLWPQIQKRISVEPAMPRRSPILRFPLPRHIHLSLPQALAAGFVLAAFSGSLVWWALRQEPAPAGAPRHISDGLAVRPSIGAPGVDSARAGAGAVAIAPPALARPGASAATASSDAAQYAAYEAHYDQAIAELERTVQEHRTELDTSTVRVVEQNLVIIDHAIEQARRALERDPASPYLHQHLALEMKLKLDLLRRTAAFAG